MNRRTFLAVLLATAGQQLLVPLAGTAGEETTLRVAVISDLNHSYGTVGYDPPVRRAIRRIIALKPDLVLCTGDMIAGQRTAPKLKRPRLESMWRSFFQTVVHPLAKAGIPLAPTPGNHDASALPGFLLERGVYQEMWEKYRPSLPLLSGGNYPFYYAFIRDDVLFVGLDITVAAPLPAEQKQWLANLLTRADRYRSRIVFGHIPLAPLTAGRQRSFLRDPDLQQLLVRTGVTLYLSGHHHAFYPFYLAGLHCTGQAALGSGPRRLIGASKRSPRAFTLLAISSDGTVRVKAYMGRNFRQELKRAALPGLISTDGVTITRDDLVKQQPTGAVRIPLTKANGKIYK